MTFYGAIFGLLGGQFGLYFYDVFEARLLFPIFIFFPVFFSFFLVPVSGLLGGRSGTRRFVVCGDCDA
jgi:hypothetical protein